MRYSLRNQKKIENYYDKAYLNRMLDSLKVYFAKGKIEEIEMQGEKFKVIAVSDCGHSVNDFIFYIISRHFDVFNLAFKEVLG